MNPLPPACEKCAPLDGAWQDTDRGLRRCDCPRGKELQSADTRRRNEIASRNQKQADKEAGEKKAKRDQWIARKRADAKLARKYREMPLMEGGSD